jgi:hypothetical protein
LCSKLDSLAAGCLCILSRMEKKELTPKQISAVPCPTCGAAARERCELHSGAPRSEPHVERKFSAIEAAEREIALTPGKAS